MNDSVPSHKRYNGNALRWEDKFALLNGVVTKEQFGGATEVDGIYGWIFDCTIVDGSIVAAVDEMEKREWTMGWSSFKKKSQD